MSTLTLALEDYFKPEVSLPSAQAAGPASVPRGMMTMSHPPPAFDLSSFLKSKSTPELASAPEKEEILSSKDDSGSSVLWARARPCTDQCSLFAPLPFVDVPQVIEAVPASAAPDIKPEILVTQIAPRSAEPSALTPIASAGDEFSVLAKPRSVSEDASISPPLRKLKLSLKLPHLARLVSLSQLSPKSVRFASKLEKVKMFSGRDSPSTVSLQNTPIGSPSYHFPVEDYFSIHHNFNDLGFSEDEYESSTDSEDEAKEKTFKINSSNFVPPRNIYDRRDCPLYLQSATMSADKRLLVLLVMCQNLAFEKQLLVKMTFNHWKSLMIYNSATYVKLFSLVNFDQFKFSIPLVHLPSNITPEFCIKFVASGVTYWDNNDSKNYTLSLSAFKEHTNAKRFIKPTTDSFTYKPPAFSTRSGSDFPGLLLMGSTPPKQTFSSGLKSEAPNYNELVHKLMSVQVADKMPSSGKPSGTQSPRPRYSQSFMKKSESNTELAPAAVVAPEAPTQAKAKPVIEARYSTTHTTPTANSNFKYESAPTSPAAGTLDSNPKSMSYADLLQKYCFVGADNGSKSAPAPMVGSGNTSSCNSSSASITSDYFTPSSTFQSLSDTFYI